MDYSSSHLGHGRGELYEERIASDWRLRYVTSREEIVLRRLVTRRFNSRPVRVLDFACGTGRITAMLRPAVTSVVGVDVSSDMLSVALRRGVDAEFVGANLLVDNVLQGQRFDVVTAFRFFSNAEADLRLKAMQTLATLLEDDGILVFNIHQNAGAPGTIAGQLWSWFRGAVPHKTMSVRQARELAAAAGLRIVESYSVGLLLPPSPRVVFPAGAPRALDRMADAAGLVARWSESPILVASR